ncbi:uncharacterized protein LOC124539926 [Vanessa cardui]|uniref:uncharacterized protein LOC124539926 n=1 Tax=Vanessa cardui TaxID=171605 RepID=UPI001F143B8B|nr:uncharacterized protein LOC124539926 [Vanessa cardui]
MIVSNMFHYLEYYTISLFLLFMDTKGSTPSEDDIKNLFQSTQTGETRNDTSRKYTTRTTTRRRTPRTTPFRVSFEESCDYLAHYCLKAYNTGTLCARTLYYTYHTFKNYCLLDYVNCMERYEVWQVVHMGQCLNITELSEYLVYPYDDDYFLDQYYVMEDH